MISAIEVIRNSYSKRPFGSEAAGSVLEGLRNIAFNAIEMSEFAKYNFMNFASGNLTHPVKYEWL